MVKPNHLNGMISVEKILKGLSHLIVNKTINDTWHRDFVTNVMNHVARGNPLSTNQSAVILKLAEKNINGLSSALNLSKKIVEDSIKNPRYDNQPYQSISVKREVRYLGSNKLAFRFKADPTVVRELKSCNGSDLVVEKVCRFDPKYRIWVVEVTAKNLETLYGIISRHRFDFDESVLEYMTLCANSKKAVSTVVYDEEGDQIVFNVCNNPVLAEVVRSILRGTEV